MTRKVQIIVSHPTGNANLRAVIQGAASHGMLAEFHTTVASHPGSPLLKIMPSRLSREFVRRQYPINPGYIKTHPFHELGRLFAPKVGLKFLSRHEAGIFSVDSVYQNLDTAVAKRLQYAPKPDAVYAYEDGAEATFTTARQKNISCLYDLPIGYYKAFRHLMEKELQERPEWAPTLTGFRDSHQKLSRKDRELGLADHIFVASSFTKNTLKYFDGPLCEVSVIPYGFPPVAENRSYVNSEKGPLKLLFVGGLSQRKGIANIFEAVEALQPDVTLTVIGRKAVEDCAVLNYSLAKHRYIPSLPHHEILTQMQAHDVLLFPSLFEGFGLVVTEAMSQGTPVIASERTCAPDLITHGENGWIEEAGNTKALIGRIASIVKHRHLAVAAGQKALATAKKRPWHVYGTELSLRIAEVLH